MGLVLHIPVSCHHLSPMSACCEAACDGGCQERAPSPLLPGVRRENGGAVPSCWPQGAADHEAAGVQVCGLCSPLGTPGPTCPLLPHVLSPLTPEQAGGDGGPLARDSPSSARRDICVCPHIKRLHRPWGLAALCMSAEVVIYPMWLFWWLWR